MPRMWTWLSGDSPSTLLRCSLLARARLHIYACSNAERTRNTQAAFSTLGGETLNTRRLRRLWGRWGLVPRPHGLPDQLRSKLRTSQPGGSSQGCAYKTRQHCAKGDHRGGVYISPEATSTLSSHLAEFGSLRVKVLLATCESYARVAVHCGSGLLISRHCSLSQRPSVPITLTDWANRGKRLQKSSWRPPQSGGLQGGLVFDFFDLPKL